MKTKIDSLVPLLTILLLLSSCATMDQRDPGKREAQASGRRITSSAQQPHSLSDHVARFGLNVYYANLHAHHYMTYKATKKSGAPDDLVTEGPCDPKIFGSFPDDDGRPCRQVRNAETPDFIVPEGFERNKPLDKLAYLRLACDHARKDGGLDILFITPHSKNNASEGDADTEMQGYVERHRLLTDINKSYNGEFYCGLGQEASSISSGNHTNIFGQFLSYPGQATKPVFFPTGRYDLYYPQIKKRRMDGERLVLQFNHPDVTADISWKALSEVYDPSKKSFRDTIKEKFNDYGLDDYLPGACLRYPGNANDLCTGKPRPQAATNEILKRTFSNIRSAGGDAYRLVEITEVGGATSNFGTGFRRVHKRLEKPETAHHVEDGLLAYIFFLDMGFKISPTANQDNHFMNYGSAIASRTGVLAKSLDENDVMQALDERLTFASEDRNAKLFLSAQSNDIAVPMGQDIQVRNDFVDITTSYQDDDEPDAIDMRIYAYHESDKLDYASTRGRVHGVVRTVQSDNGTPRLPTGAETPSDFTEWLKSGEAKTLRVPLRKGRTTIFIEYTQRDFDKIWSAPLFVESL